MKKGKLILGAVAFIITAISAFALKRDRTRSLHRLYGTAGKGGSCFHVTCWTNFIDGTSCGSCHLTTFFGSIVAHVYTIKTAAGGKCKDAYTGLCTHIAN
jgi:hypothetical protein